MKHWKFSAVLFIALAALAAPAVFADAPTGASPLDPLRVTGAWQTLAPNASLWFYFDYTGDRSKIEAMVEDDGTSHMQLAIFTPMQATAWLQDPTTKPIGWGSKPGAHTPEAIYDLYWRGAFNFPGRFFAVVSNQNAQPIVFRLNVKGENVRLAPTPTPTRAPTPFLATPIPTATLPGKIVFQQASGGNIYTVNGDGSQLARVSTGLDPAWSPDGKQIALTRWEHPAGVYIAEADGSNERNISSARQPLSPQWSPDGARVAFTRPNGGPQYDSTFCFGRFCFTAMADPWWKIAVVDVNTLAFSEPRCTKHCFSPTWHTDNKTIAYADAQIGIMATSIEGGDAWTLYTQNPNVQSSIYSPDGSKLAFMFRQHDHWEIGVINADGSGMIGLTRQDPLAFAVVNNVAPTWSPDGAQVLFLSDRNGKWEFFVVNADGTGLHQALKSVTDVLPIYYNFSNERVADWTNR